MTTFNTGNAVPSADARDRCDNSQVFDELMNGPAPSTPDRLGVLRQSWAGMELAFSNFLLASGFEAQHLVYVPGETLQVERPTQLIDYNGSVYRVKMPSSFPVLLSGDWTTDQALLTDVGDSALRQELSLSGGSSMIGDGAGTVAEKLASLYPFRNITPEQFGDTGDGATVTANDAINAALLFAKTNGGYVNLTPGKTYLIDGNANPIFTTITGDRNGGVIMQNGVRLNMNGAILKSTVSTRNGYSIVNFTNCTGSVLAGPGRIWGDVDLHGATGGEYGYGAFLTQCSNCHIEGNVAIDRCWGDGIFFGEGTPGDASTAPVFCTVADVTCDYNRRQGVSIVGASDLTFVNCVFKRTGRIKGIAPSAGFDLETDNVPGQVNRRIKFFNCDIYDNAGVGGAASGLPLSAQDIELYSCRFSGNDNGALRTEFGSCASMKVFGGTLDGGITGGQNVELHGVDIIKSQGNLTGYAILLDADASFKMYGGSVVSKGSTQQLFYSAGTSKESAKNYMHAVDFTYESGSAGLCLNPNGINVWDNCNFYVGGTVPAGNFGFDAAKFDGVTAQIDNCYFDPSYHSGYSGEQFKGRFSINRERGGMTPSNFSPTAVGKSSQYQVYQGATEQGSAGSKYVIFGQYWVADNQCVQLRCLTGN